MARMRKRVKSLQAIIYNNKFIKNAYSNGNESEGYDLCPIGVAVNENGHLNKLIEFTNKINPEEDYKNVIKVNTFCTKLTGLTLREINKIIHLNDNKKTSKEMKRYVAYLLAKEYAR